MIDPLITKQIINAWNADESNPNHERNKRPLPDEEIIHKLIVTSFLATLHDEEGHSVSFSVVLMPQEFKEAHRPGSLPPLKFKRPIPFTASNIPKIAAAFEPELSSLIVDWDRSKSELFIWGVYLHSPKLNIFSIENSIHVEGKTGPRPDFLTVISKGRGSIALTRRNVLIGSLHGGYFSAASPTPFTSCSLGGYMMNLIQQDELFKEYGNPYWHLFRTTVDLILSEASYRGHGSTIILVTSQPSPSTELYIANNAFENSFNLWEGLRQCMKHIKEFPRLLGHNKVVDETIQRISQLATVDGALILTSKFEVLAFGSTLKAPISDKEALLGPDGYGRFSPTPYDISRYGTRHKSAFNFVSACPDAIAFVISQDGPIRAFRSESKHKVYVWPDCTISMSL